MTRKTERLSDADLAALTERRWGDVQYGSKDSWNGTLVELARELQEARAVIREVLDLVEGLDAELDGRLTCELPSAPNL